MLDGQRHVGSSQGLIKEELIKASWAAGSEGRIFGRTQALWHCGQHVLCPSWGGSSRPGPAAPAGAWLCPKLAASQGLVTSCQGTAEGLGLAQESGAAAAWPESEPEPGCLVEQESQHGQHLLLGLGELRCAVSTSGTLVLPPLKNGTTTPHLLSGLSEYSCCVCDRQYGTDKRDLSTAVLHCQLCPHPRGRQVLARYSKKVLAKPLEVPESLIPCPRRFLWFLGIGMTLALPSDVI